MLTATPLPLLTALIAALATTRLLVRRVGAPDPGGRFATIDGLRGYLAFFVFVHHACVWYFHLRTDRWEAPPSHLYTQLGEASVALFFMITGFLFCSKLIEARAARIDWLGIYVSRLLRLAPLYLIAVAALLVIVVALSGGTLNQPPAALASGIVRWLSFTIPGDPDLNKVERTAVIVAGVTWTLRYEWLFYFCLPWLAVATGGRASPIAAAWATAGIALALRYWTPEPILLAPFLGGIAAAFARRLPAFAAFARRPVGSAIAIACLAGEATLFATAYGPVQLALLGAAFCLIACGADLFGALSTATSRMLGEMTYGIYLLHGIVLFVAFRFVLGRDASAGLSDAAYWSVVLALVPLLLAICYAALVAVERPAIGAVPRVTKRLRRALPTLDRRGAGPRTR